MKSFVLRKSFKDAVSIFSFVLGRIVTEIILGDAGFILNEQDPVYTTVKLEDSNPIQSYCSIIPINI